MLKLRPTETVAAVVVAQATMTTTTVSWMFYSTEFYSSNYFADSHFLCRYSCWLNQSKRSHTTVCHWTHCPIWCVVVALAPERVKRFHYFRPYNFIKMATTRIRHSKCGTKMTTMVHWLTAPKIFPHKINEMIRAQFNFCRSAFEKNSQRIKYWSLMFVYTKLLTK